jgi:hypothetical protein
MKNLEHMLEMLLERSKFFEYKRQYIQKLMGTKEIVKRIQILSEGGSNQ